MKARELVDGLVQARSSWACKDDLSNFVTSDTIDKIVLQIKDQFTKVQSKLQASRIKRMDSINTKLNKRRMVSSIVRNKLSKQSTNCVMNRESSFKAMAQ